MTKQCKELNITMYLPVILVQVHAYEKL